MEYYTRFIGLDVHKESIAVALAYSGRGEPEYLGRIANSPQAVRKWLNRMSSQWGGLEGVLVCYEAGPCGFVLYRQLTELGVACQVVAPGLIPRKATDRVKTDRRDASSLARLLRAGELTAIWVPDDAHEAFRDLLRAREGAVVDRTRGRNQLNQFLLRHGQAYPGPGKNWTCRHQAWLDSLHWNDSSIDMVVAEYRQRIRECEQRVARFDEQVREFALISPWQETIKALQCLRGFSLITAATVCAEVGSSARFMNPRQLMSYTGLVPGEASSGFTVRRLSITKAGNAHLRRIMIEASWHYRHRPHVGQKLGKRQRGQPPEVIAASWRAQTRLNKRYRHLVGRGKCKNEAVVAVARELLGFVWEIMQIIPGPGARQELAA